MSPCEVSLKRDVQDKRKGVSKEKRIKNRIKTSKRERRKGCAPRGGRPLVVTSEWRFSSQSSGGKRAKSSNISRPCTITSFCILDDPTQRAALSHVCCHLSIGLARRERRPAQALLFLQPALVLPVLFFLAGLLFCPCSCPAAAEKRRPRKDMSCRVLFCFLLFFPLVILFFCGWNALGPKEGRGCLCVRLPECACCCVLPLFFAVACLGTERERARAVLVCDGVSPLVGRQPKPHRDGRAHLHCRQTAARQRPMMQQYKLLKPPARWLAWLAGQRALRRPASLA